MDSSSERRAGRRFNAEVDVEWESASGKFHGVLSDVSLTGCFVLCSERVTDGEPVKLIVPEGWANGVEFFGNVANSTVDVGFAIRFRDVSEAQRQILAKLVQES